MCVYKDSTTRKITWRLQRSPTPTYDQPEKPAGFSYRLDTSNGTQVHGLTFNRISLPNLPQFSLAGDDKMFDGFVPFF